MVGFIALMVVLYTTGCSMQGNNGPANIVHTYFNSLRPHKSRSTLAQVRACCLMAANPFLNQCWLLIKGVLWHSPESTCTKPTGQDMHMNFIETLFEDYGFKIITTSLRGQTHNTPLTLCWALFQIVSVTATRASVTAGFFVMTHMLWWDWSRWLLISYGSSAIILWS